MNRIELNTEIEKLKVSLEAHEEQVKDLSHDLKIATQRLEDCDKPKLTEKQFASIEEAIESAISDYNFEEYDQYEYELSMEYDNRVELSHIEFRNASDLAGEVYTSVERLFGITDESDDDDESPSE
tara:strand:+ start:477 stop:854 length:378 start_codon:yes stop_codon:yes gene_type:complete